MVLQRFSSPVNTLLPKKATTPVTFSKPISVMTLLAPPMTRRMTRAAKCQSKPIMKRKMTRLTAWTNKETLLQCMQHYIQYNGGITVPLRSVPSLYKSFSSSTYWTTAVSSLWRKEVFKHFVTHISRFYLILYNCREIKIKIYILL